MEASITNDFGKLVRVGEKRWEVIVLENGKSRSLGIYPFRKAQAVRSEYGCSVVEALADALKQLVAEQKQKAA